MTHEDRLRAMFANDELLGGREEYKNAVADLASRGFAHARGVRQLQQRAAA